MMTYALGPDHVHVTVSYMHKKFKKNECKLRQLINYQSVGLFILTMEWAFLQILLKICNFWAHILGVD